MSVTEAISADMEYILRVTWVAHGGAGTDTGARALTFMSQLLPQGHFEMVDRQPDILLFMSGGSERRAIEAADPGRPVLLLSIPGNNAYAAATEVMAWMNGRGRVAMLGDAADAAESGLIERWRTVAGAWQSIKGLKAGLIGTVSEWLVASGVPEDTLMQRFGIILEEIPWDSLPGFAGVVPDKALTDRFEGYDAPGMKEAAQVMTVLREVTEEKKLRAIAVECFSLVQQQKVTACLALAQLNTEGTVATCEGDLASMAGMILLQAVTGRVPWMANTTRLTSEGVILSHCTAPFNLVSNISLPTHYETGQSLAVDGMFDASVVTLFRLNDRLDRAFMAEGRVTSHPGMNDACRTQVEIEVPADCLDLLRRRPLGNHLLMVPGRHSEIMNLALKYRAIEIIN